jgi:hypothetical protein
MTDQPQNPRFDAPAAPPGAAPPPPAPGPYPAPAADPSYKPAKVTAIAVLALVDGVVNVLFGAGWFLGIFALGVSTLGCGCLLLPLGLYPLVLGVFELVYAAQILPQDPRDVRPARWLAILQILNVLLGQVLSVVAGILTLVFLDDPEVRRWFAARAPWTPGAPPPGAYPPPPQSPPPSPAAP